MGKSIWGQLHQSRMSRGEAERDIYYISRHVLVSQASGRKMKKTRPARKLAVAAAALFG